MASQISEYQQSRIDEISGMIRRMVESGNEDNIHYAPPERLAEFAFGVDGEFTLAINGVDVHYPDHPPMAIVVLDHTGKIVHVSDSCVQSIIDRYCPETLVNGRFQHTPDAPDHPMTPDEKRDIVRAAKTLSAARAKIMHYGRRRMEANR